MHMNLSQEEKYIQRFHISQIMTAISLHIWGHTVQEPQVIVPYSTEYHICGT